MKNFPAILCCVGVLLLAYIASYSLDVRRGNKWGFEINLVGHHAEGQKLPISTSYRFGGRWAEKIYSPLQSLDRRVRADYWNVTFHGWAAKP